MSSAATTAGKGNITLDDIARGITYKDEPFNKANRFVVLTPDAESQQKFFYVNNYTHKYLTKEKRSLYVEYRDTRPPIPANLLPPPKPVESVAPKPAKEETKKPVPQPPTVAASPQKKAAVKVAVAKAAARHSRGKSARRGIYHPGELYSPQRCGADDPYGLANPYSDTKYNDMRSTLGVKGGATLRDVLRKSEEVRNSLAQTLKTQGDRKALRNMSLPPMPKERQRLVIADTQVCKNGAKRASNGAHCELTNGGYTRTSYGGFYMH